MDFTQNLGLTRGAIWKPSTSPSWETSTGPADEAGFPARRWKRSSGLFAQARASRRLPLPLLSPRCGGSFLSRKSVSPSLQRRIAGNKQVEKSESYDSHFCFYTNNLFLHAVVIEKCPLNAYSDFENKKSTGNFVFPVDFWYARLDSNQWPTESESVTLSN